MSEENVTVVGDGTDKETPPVTVDTRARVSHHCSAASCGRDFSYGMMVVRGHGKPRDGEEQGPPKIYCENCARKLGVSGTAVIFGGGKKPEGVSSVARDRAQRKLKKLARMTRRA